MKAKALIATAVAAAAILVPVTSASASSEYTYWTWTAKYAANEVAGSVLTWNNDADDYITYSECRGIGKRHSGNQFHKHNCYVETEDGESYVIRVVANGAHAFKYRFLRWA
jgi:hypothetical protein